jgi:hypothetical protein
VYWSSFDKKGDFSPQNPLTYGKCLHLHRSENPTYFISCLMVALNRLKIFTQGEHYNIVLIVHKKGKTLQTAQSMSKNSGHIFLNLHFFRIKISSNCTNELLYQKIRNSFKKQVTSHQIKQTWKHSPNTEQKILTFSVIKVTKLKYWNAGKKENISRKDNEVNEKKRETNACSVNEYE